jgi:hypothetical protein
VSTNIPPYPVLFDGLLRAKTRFLHGFASKRNYKKAPFRIPTVSRLRSRVPPSPFFFDHDRGKGRETSNDPD